MRIVFMGSPQEVISPLNTLKSICDNTDHDIVAVVSQPPKKIGRRGILADPPLAAHSKSLKLKVLQPESAKSQDFLAELISLQPDLIITAAYGQILSEEFLAIPKVATINIHPSLLPMYRGATPVPAALLDGSTETGISILFTVKKLDAGDIVLQEKASIGLNDTSGELTKKLFERGGHMLKNAIELLSDPNFKGSPQNESEVTFCHKISKQDGQINWGLCAQQVINRYKAFTPWPSVFTFFQGKRLTITKMVCIPHTPSNSLAASKPGSFHYDKHKKALLVTCAENKCVEIERIKPEGSKELDIASFINGIKGVKSGVFDEK